MGMAHAFDTRRFCGQVDVGLRLALPEVGRARLTKSLKKFVKRIRERHKSSQELEGGVESKGEFCLFVLGEMNDCILRRMVQERNKLMMLEKVETQWLCL